MTTVTQGRPRPANPMSRRVAPDLVFEDVVRIGDEYPVAFAGHERLVRCRDAATGLNAIVAVHDRSLGPAVGGCRMLAIRATPRAHADAVDAALGLSRAATRQAALYGLSLGGAAVIIVGNPRLGKSPALFRMLGRFAGRLGGGLILTTGLGVAGSDLDFAAMETPFVIGATPGGGGDPAIATAYGVMLGMQAAVARRHGHNRLAGLRIAIQGVGRVGYALATLLKQQGAHLIVADVDHGAVVRAVDGIGVEVVSPESIHRTPADVLAPCAGAGTLDERTIPELAAAVVAGSAHGQLARPEHAECLRRRGIVHVPDIVLNAGGLLNAANELDRAGYDRGVALAQVGRIGPLATEILGQAEAAGVSPTAVAEAKADAAWSSRRRRLRLATRTPAWVHA